MLPVGCNLGGQCRDAVSIVVELEQPPTAGLEVVDHLVEVAAVLARELTQLRPALLHPLELPAAIGIQITEVARELSRNLGDSDRRVVQRLSDRRQRRIVHGNLLD